MIGGIDKFFGPVQIQRSTETVDEWGNPVEVWADHIIVEGKLRQLSGSELYQSRKETPVATHRLYCRLDDITVNDRIVFNDEIYDIIRVNDVMNFGELMQVDAEYVQN
jgi:SPP1 family predicted phage head-tail adaptor